MKVSLINTNEYYHEIINTPDAAARHQRYCEKFIQPWQAMMSMFSQNPDDELAGARAWHWLLPDDLIETPNSLTILENAQAWRVAQQALEKAAASFDPYAEQLPLDSVEGWLVLANPQTSDPVMRGYTGAVDWMQPRFVAQFDTPNDYNLPRLPGLVVHEMHHLIRLRLFPWDMVHTSVADYIVHEGMAESFAAALFGADIVGYFVTDFDEAELSTAKNLIRDGLQAKGFNVIRGYIFGDYWADKMHFDKVGGMPTYGGYAIGYHVVQAYLQRTGKTVQEATFLSADEIVEESGFFV